MKRILKSLAFILGMLMLPTVAYTQNMYADVNGDLEVNIADINAVISVILSDVSNPSADVNGDGEINIADINAVIDFILNGGFDPHLLEVCERVSDADNDIMYYYNKCQSIEELKEYADVIKMIDGVEDVYFDDNLSMFVDMKDFRTLIYSYYPEPDEEFSINMRQLLLNQIQTNLNVQDRISSYPFSGIKDAKFLVVNQQIDMNYSVQSASMACSIFSKLGFEADIVNSPDIDFFRSGIFDCDYLFIIAHGSYNPRKDIHWTATSIRAPHDKNGKVDPTWLEAITRRYKENEVTLSTSNYVMVSQHFIKTSTKQFNHLGKGIVFNVACQSMKGSDTNTNGTNSINTNLAKVFVDKGAGAYIGYDESSWGGQLAGLRFWSNMLSGMSIGNAFDYQPFELLHEYHKNNNPKFWANLQKYPELGDFYNICINRPLVSFEDKSNDNQIRIDLHSSNLYMSYIEPTGYHHWNIVNDLEGLSELPYEYGFELSESERFIDVISIGEKLIGEDGLGSTYLDYTITLTYDSYQTNSQIKPNTTYWARAYVFDGSDYNYSEPITFTTGSITGEDNEWVDLGLPSGTLWATRNIGASSPEDYGDYFAWGETESKDYYNKSSYKWCYDYSDYWMKLSKYNTDGDYGMVDNKTELELEDDAAYVNWGSLWRMPTHEQQKELVEKCSWTSARLNGVNGQLVTGPNGKSLFLPEAGYYYKFEQTAVGQLGYYWSRMLSIDEPEYAYSLSFDGFSAIYLDDSYRVYGHTVRAVRVP